MAVYPLPGGASWFTAPGSAARATRLFQTPSAGSHAADRRLHRGRLDRRPLQVRVGNRIAVRIVRRVPERLVDPRLELLGDHVLEPVRLVVDVLDVEPERARQIELEQAMVPDNLERDALAGRGQAGAVVGLVLEQLEGGQLLQHRRGRGGGDALIASERRDRCAPAGGLELVDPLEVVLDRLGERRRSHQANVPGLVAWRVVHIRVGHSADPDDAFMFWAIEAGKVDMRGLELEQVVSDIQTLNVWATEARLEVTAISMGAYASVADRYVLLPHGASMGIGYGPIVVAREPLDLDALREAEIVIPGRLTTAYLALRLALGADPAVREQRFDLILDEVASGRAEAGLIIHEGQLTYGASGLRKVIDLGEWWQGETGLPLPLGVNVARADLGDRLPDVSAVLSEAIRTGLDHRDEALEYAEQFGRGIDRATADRFVEMYVNELTCDYGDIGRRAVDELLRRSGSGVTAVYA